MTIDADPTTTKNPRKSSDRRIEANRINAKKSTGPKTAAGKAASSQNARKHGLRAAITVLPHEDLLQFERHCQDFYAALQPRDAVEAKLVSDAISSAWRLDRAVKNETAVLSKKVQAAALLHEIAFHEEFATLRRALPSNPRKVCVQLRMSTLGCQWMIDQLSMLITTLETRGFWYPSERDVVLNIFGLTTEDLFLDSLAYEIVAAFVSAGWSTETNGDLFRVQALIRSGAPEGMAIWEYRHRVDCLARATREADPEASRAKLIDLLRPELETLAARVDLLRPIEETLRNTSSDREMVDTTRDGELRLRYEAMHRRDFQKAIRELEFYRKTFKSIEVEETPDLPAMAEYRSIIAPNEAKALPADPRHEPENRPRNPAADTAKSAIPDLVDEVQGTRKSLGFPPRERHELNELIDDTIPDLNQLRSWADQIEDEQNARAVDNELLK